MQLERNKLYIESRSYSNRMGSYSISPLKGWIELMSENFPRTKKFPKSKKCSKVFCLNKICVARSYHPSVEKLPNVRPIPILHVSLVTHETDSSSPDSRCCAESDQSSESNAQQFCCFEFFCSKFWVPPIRERAFLVAGNQPRSLVYLYL